MHSKKKYRPYIVNADTPVPKTSRWRHKKLAGHNLPEGLTKGHHASCAGSKRKAYLHDSSHPIPRQTMSYWKKKVKYTSIIFVPSGHIDFILLTIAKLAGGCTSSGKVDLSDSESDSMQDKDINENDDGNDFEDGFVHDDVGQNSESHSREWNDGCLDQLDSVKWRREGDGDDHDGDGFKDNNDNVDNESESTEDNDLMNELVQASASNDDVTTSEPGQSCFYEDEDNNTVDTDDQYSTDSDLDNFSENCATERPAWDDETQTGSADGSKLSSASVYEGSSISTTASWFSMMHYAVSNRLSYKAMEDLITLIKAHCPSSGNNCPKSLHEFRKYFESLNNQMMMHFCSICFAVLDDGNKTCIKRNCIKNKAKICDLALFSIEDRLKQLYEEHDEFRYPFTRHADENHLRDIHDGSVVKHLMMGTGFLSVPENTGLVLCSDGVPVYKSSKGSLWPVYLMVTSIPPQKRTKVDNLIIAALWHGPTKPVMDIIFKPILNSISELETSGIPLSSKVLRAKLLMGVFDLPAKSSATNTKQFNGEYGCLYCLHKGEIYQGARVYCPKAEVKLRDNDMMKEWALTADRTGESQFGVKGSCILGKYIEIPECIPIDYMHSVLEGAFKQLMKHWFDQKFYSQPYSLRKHIPSINRLLAQIKPVNEIQRMPRSLDSLSFYKASEYRAWLLFYVLPVLSLFLPPEYVHHLSLLVSSVHILLSDEIKKEDLAVVHNMLSTFYQASGELYSSSSIYTANMHSLIHTVPFVQLWGPLWVYSMFGFENLNGYLNTTFHGTRRIVYQMSFQIQLLQTLPKKLLSLSESEPEPTRDFIRQLVMKKKTNFQELSEHCYVVGKISSYCLTQDELTIVSTSFGITIDSSVQLFEKMILNNVIYYSSNRSRTVTTSRNNTMCFYLDSNQSIAIGQIQSFFISMQHSHPLAILHRYTITGNSPINELRPPRNSMIRQLHVHFLLSKQIIEVEPTEKEMVALSIQHILRKCMLIRLKFSGQVKMYCIPLPNSLEVH